MHWCIVERKGNLWSPIINRIFGHSDFVERCHYGTSPTRWCNGTMPLPRSLKWRKTENYYRKQSYTLTVSTDISASIPLCYYFALGCSWWFISIERSCTMHAESYVPIRRLTWASHNVRFNGVFQQYQWAGIGIIIFSAVISYGDCLNYARYSSFSLSAALVHSLIFAVCCWDIGPPKDVGYTLQLNRASVGCSPCS